SDNSSVQPVNFPPGCKGSAPNTPILDSPAAKHPHGTHCSQSDQTTFRRPVSRLRQPYPAGSLSPVLASSPETSKSPSCPLRSARSTLHPRQGPCSAQTFLPAASHDDDSSRYS